MMQTYRTNSISLAKRYVCDEMDHVLVVDVVLKGGQGPDDAGWAGHCKKCQCFAWKYCDGTVGWRTDPSDIVRPHRSLWWKIRAKWHHLRRRVWAYWEPFNGIPRIPIRDTRRYQMEKRGEMIRALKGKL